MDNRRVFLGLDVGEQRIGLATGDSIGRIAQPIGTIQPNESVPDTIKAAIGNYDVQEIVVGRPRNQAGDITGQTRSVETFAKAILEPLQMPIHWQDESVTSVIAEERLKARKKPYAKGDIDAEAASIILQDFLEQL